MYKFKVIGLLVILVGFQLVSLSFASDFDKWDKWDKMDKMDKKKFNNLIEEAKSCSEDWEFSCARSKLKKAKQYIVDMKDEDRLANAWDYYEQEQEEHKEYKERQRRAERSRSNQCKFRVENAPASNEWTVELTGEGCQVDYGHVRVKSTTDGYEIWISSMSGQDTNYTYRPEFYEDNLHAWRAPGTKWDVDSLQEAIRKAAKDWTFQNSR